MSDDVKVTNAPERIYLQIGDDFAPGEVDFTELTEVTWCADNIHGTDIAYVRSAALEAALARIAALESQIAAAEKREPVGVAGNMPGTEGFTMAAFKTADVPVGMNLYTHPLPSDAEGWRKDAEILRTLVYRAHAFDLKFDKAGKVSGLVATFKSKTEPSIGMSEGVRNYLDAFMADAALAKQQGQS